MTAAGETTRPAGDPEGSRDGQVDILEHGLAQQTSTRRLFVQLQVFAGCGDAKPLVRALERAQVEGVLGRLAMGLTALVAVTVPLAVVWAVLGVWLGRAQHRRVTDGSAPARAVRGEEAVAL